MPSGYPPQFVRRTQFGMVDSICTRCFRTIASTTHGDDLDAAEGSHVCARIDLASLHYPDKPNPVR
jgi:hypothetical protein